MLLLETRSLRHERAGEPAGDASASEIQDPVPSTMQRAFRRVRPPRQDLLSRSWRRSLSRSSFARQSVFFRKTTTKDGSCKTRTAVALDLRADPLRPHADRRRHRGSFPRAARFQRRRHRARSRAARQARQRRQFRSARRWSRHSVGDRGRAVQGQIAEGRSFSRWTSSPILSDISFLNMSRLLRRSSSRRRRSFITTFTTSPICQFAN